MTKFKNNFIRTITFIFVLFILVISSFWSSGAGLLCAAASDVHSDVLEDLEKDKNFSVRDYPKKPLDYSMTVIQIAESADGEFFIYVYQPYGQTRTLLATSMNLSTSIHTNLRYENYKLTLISSAETLYKYKVENFTVKKDMVRYYDISSIYRKWNASINGNPENGNTVSEVALPVGQLWTASTLEGKVSYTMVETEVIQVTNQTVGFRRYSEGVTWTGGKAVDAHFFAFSTNREIDRLISADLEFFTQNYQKVRGNTTLEKKEKHFITLYYDEFSETNGGGWFGKKARWDRMASSEEFLNSGLEFTDEEKERFSKYQWVLNFYETAFDLQQNINFLFPWLPSVEYLITGDSSYLGDISGTLVSEVSLLRLEFEYDGKIYNLGVVSNKQTGSPNPSNSSEKITLDTIRLIFGLVGLILLIILLYPILSPIFNLVAKGIVWLVSAPFKALGKLFQKNNQEKK